MSTPASSSEASAHLSRDLAIAPRGTAELSGFAVANAAGHQIGVPKGAQSENSHVINYFQDTDPSAKIRCLVSLMRS
jgi:hypothetical protein